ncbi:hypothetical protein GCM10009530_48060 [Microbispora corallina]|uniref:Uncharacterized protein n=1 Tax=Microbispora corallina TaxID=83302 RepID=A0ABQ4G5S1_9ACTN|nr:hypothetical protein [Microbispora corallina]GIH42381.1 hypothetical protein Mco01_53810 [Microbispora corallina]
MTSSPHGARRRRPVLVPVASALAAAGIGVTALLGGLKDAPDKPPPKVGPGDVIDQGEFRTQFIKAIDTTEKGDFGDTKRYLELVLKVTNMGDATTHVGTLPKPGDKFSTITGFAGSLLRTRPEIKTKYGPEASVLSYGIKSQQLHPGITTTVVVKYELEPTATAPEEIGVDLGGYSYDPVGLRDQTHYWQLVGEEDDKGVFTPTVAAQITLPVRRESE